MMQLLVSTTCCDESVAQNCFGIWGGEGSDKNLLCRITLGLEVDWAGQKEKKADDLGIKKLSLDDLKKML